MCGDVGLVMKGRSVKQVRRTNERVALPTCINQYNTCAHARSERATGAGGYVPVPYGFMITEYGECTTEYRTMLGADGQIWPIRRVSNKFRQGTKSLFIFPFRLNNAAVLQTNRKSHLLTPMLYCFAKCHIVTICDLLSTNLFIGNSGWFSSNRELSPFYQPYHLTARYICTWLLLARLHIVWEGQTSDALCRLSSSVTLAYATQLTRGQHTTAGQ